MTSQKSEKDENQAKKSEADMSSDHFVSVECSDALTPLSDPSRIVMLTSLFALVACCSRMAFSYIGGST